VADQLVETSFADLDGDGAVGGQDADVVRQVALETVVAQQGEHQFRIVGAAGEHGAHGREHDGRPTGPGARRDLPYGHRGGHGRQFHP